MEAYPDDAGHDMSGVSTLMVGADQVRANFDRYGLLDDQVRFLEGWFADTLPMAPIEQLAILRLDGDLYESTMDALVPLYEKVSPGGFVIVDDYGAWEPCRRPSMTSERSTASPTRSSRSTGPGSTGASPETGQRRHRLRSDPGRRTAMRCRVQKASTIGLPTGRP